MIKFFERCRTLANVLTVICVITGIPVFSFLIFEFKELFGGYVEIENLLFVGLLAILLIVFTVLTVALRLIIKDAQEDISAALNYKQDANKE